MKKSMYLILTVLLLASCESKQAKIIKDYEQKIDENTVIDLNLKVKELDQIGLAFAKDSFDHYVVLTDSLADIIKWEYKSKLDNNQFDYNLEEIKYKYETDPTMKKLIKEIMDAIQDGIEIEKRVLSKIENKDYRKITDEMDALLDKRDQFINQDSVIGNIWECKYSILNPMLNNAKQTLNAKYLFSSDNENLIRKIKD